MKPHVISTRHCLNSSVRRQTRLKNLYSYAKNEWLKSDGTQASAAGDAGQLPTPSPVSDTPIGLPAKTW